jgi:hypothetical protein
LPGTSEWDELLPQFELMAGARQIIFADIHAVKTSCGFSVPLYEYAGDRDLLLKWAGQKGEEGLTAYRREKNAVSMDGLVTTIGEQFV